MTLFTGLKGDRPVFGGGKKAKREGVGCRKGSDGLRGEVNIMAYGQTGSGKTHTVSRGPAETTLRLAAADVGGNSARTRFRSKRLAGMVRRAL